MSNNLRFPSADPNFASAPQSGRRREESLIPLPHLRQKCGTMAVACFATLALVALACPGRTLGASLEAQFRNLPEIKAKPESTGGSTRQTITGGNAWVQSAQSPESVPVKFWIHFKSYECDVSASLAGQVVSTNGGEGVDFVDSGTAQVSLKPYQTYQVTVQGDSVYKVDVNLSPPSLYDLFSSATIGQQPARLYKAYYFNEARQAWEKICPGNVPEWTVDDWVPLQQTFQIQIRPDLGARPVTKPGARAAAGQDQADDAWTRDEPAIDAQTVPGDASPVTISSSKQGDPASVQFNWSVAMGRIWSGSGAGRIRVSEWRLSTNVYTPQVLSYAPPASETNEIKVVMDLDDTNCLSQINGPQTLATVDPLYASALLSVTDLLDTASLVHKLTITNADSVSSFLWTNFSTNAQQVLLNTNSSLVQQQTNLLAELNRLMPGSSIYDSNRFVGISLSGRTRRSLLANPAGAALTRLNRFLMEDSYSSELARLGSSKFELNFYIPDYVGTPDSLGFFTLASGANPFVTWRLGLPDATTNQWQVQEMRNSSTNTALLAFNPTNTTWTLTRGSGADARTETRSVATNSVGGTNFCLEIQELKNGAATLSDRTAEVYQRFDWGFELVTVTNDPGGANLVTQFNYDSDTNHLDGGGKILSILYPDGFWERREYSAHDGDYDSFWWPLGSLVRTIQPWKNTPINSTNRDCLVSQYDYAVAYINVPGTYRLQKWHDDDHHGPPNEYQDYGMVDVAYQEQTSFNEDLCADTPGLITEAHELGSVVGYGDWQETTSFSAAYGRLSAQIFSKVADNYKISSYDYEFGAWDPATLAFTPAPAAPHDHDIRQTIFHGNNDFYYNDVISTGPSGATVEAVGMHPFEFLKEVRIVHGGNLAAKELYVYQGDLTNFALIERVIYQRDSLGHATNVFRVDPLTQQPRVFYRADWKGTAAWPADLKLSETDESGITYTNSYDSLKRLKTRTKLAVSGQSPLLTALSYDAANRVLTNTLSAGSLSQVSKVHYDLAGRKTDETGPDKLVTSYSYQGGGRQTTVITSSGASMVISNYLDRRVASVTGSAVTNQFFDYSMINTGDYGTSPDSYYPKNVTTTTLGSTGSLRWTAAATDHGYFPVEERKPGFRSTNIIYKTYVFTSGGGGNAPPGQPYSIQMSGLDNSVPPGASRYTPAASIEYGYDGYGHRAMERHSGNDSGYVGSGFSGPDRVTTWSDFYEMDGSTNWFHVNEQWTYPFTGDGTPSLVERTRERLTGFSSTGVAETQKFDSDTNQTSIQVTVDLANKLLTTITTTAQSSLTATQLVVNGLLQTESTPTVATPTTHYYDSLGREIAVVDALGNRAGTRFDPSTGQVTATTNALGLVTTMEYYTAGATNAGLLKCQTGPTGKKTYYNYNGCSQVIQTWGDVPYPEKRDYNQFGDLVALTTYRGGSQWSGSTWPGSPGTGDVTQWFYDEATGLLTNKMDAAGQSVKFDYYDNYFSKSRFWARGASSTNIYALNGELVAISYSDGTSVLFTNQDFQTLNRIGKPSVVIDASGTNFLAYDHAERLVSSTCTAGLLAGITVTNHFNPVYGRDALKVIGPSWALTNGYGYDAYGRMSVVSNGIYSATYAYLANSDLLQTTTSKSNTTTVLTATRTWETGPRLRSIANSVNGTIVTSHEYQYDPLDRRKGALLEDGSRWQYDYNDRDELTGGRRYWSDWSPVAGQQFGYDYDNIGNRKDARSGGDANGWNLRETDYTANNLNQYSAVVTPGYSAILGVAFATNSVTVNSASADRKTEYFHDEVSIANSSAPVWESVSISSGGSVSNGGFVFPKNSQALSYDADGNPTFDGIWAYDWDCENRLAAMTMTNVSGIANSNRLRLEFTYDQQGRRAGKTVKSWNGSAFANAVVSEFVYDGWNISAILAPDLSILNAFLWGQDLSGTEDGAAGIGGLSAVFEIAANQIANCHFAAYDGNGNVTSLINAADKSLSAQYAYAPFGETLRATGPMAAANPLRFSSKFADGESGLVVYPKRSYQPRSGRWLSWDPLGQQGCDNLYAFVLNAPMASVDPLGTLTLTEQQATLGAAALLVLGCATADLIKATVGQSIAAWNSKQIAVYSTSSTDANDDSLEEGLQGMNVELSGQLANKLPNFNGHDGNRGPRRSQTKGLNTSQNKLAERAAKEAELNPKGTGELKRILEEYSRGSKGDDAPLDYSTVLREAKELANSAKYRL
jgi:RHS repeat-associated protein